MNGLTEVKYTEKSAGMIDIAAEKRMGVNDMEMPATEVAAGEAEEKVAVKPVRR